MIEVEFNDAVIRRAFQGIERALTDTSGLMNDLGDSLLASTTKRFKAGVTPEGTAFAPRSPVTLGRYDKAGERYGKKPLWRHGDLYGKIHMQAEMDAATIGPSIRTSGVTFPPGPSSACQTKIAATCWKSSTNGCSALRARPGSVAAASATLPALSFVIGYSHLIPRKTGSNLLTP